LSYFRQVELDVAFPPFVTFLENLGFVPNLFRAQTLLPRLIEAEAGIVDAVVFRPGALSRIQKEQNLLALAVWNRNTYIAAIRYQMLSLLGVPERRIDQIMEDYRQADLSPADRALLDFAVKLGIRGTPASRTDVNRLLEHGFDDAAVLEAVLVTALGNFLCTLSTGLGTVPDFKPSPLVTSSQCLLPDVEDARDSSGGAHLRTIERHPDEFAPFALLRDSFGFVPNIYLAQLLRPDVVAAEAEMIRAILLAEDRLTRVQKEFILLAVSAANWNTYCVGLHSAVLATLGVSSEVSDLVATDHRQAACSRRDHALLDFALKLVREPQGVGRPDVDALRQQGFSEEQILEAVAMVSLANFLNTLQIGLGVTPDFTPRRTFQRPPINKGYLLADATRPTNEPSLVDPDRELVSRVQSGDTDTFEELMNKHSRRVYRTLVGVLGDPEEARDAMQDTFLKAFQHLHSFQGRSSFSTWLVSIASNTGMQRLRDRKPAASLDDAGVESEEGFRPRQVQSWTDNPEQLYSKAEMRALVENSVMRLPAKYRVVLLLRDLEQLSTEDTAVALGLGIPALKARIHRGRLMLREALAPYFAARTKGVTT
jgi:RNA polymerase sigma-70 factor (ECF subfamily)